MEGVPDVTGYVFVLLIMLTMLEVGDCCGCVPIEEVVVLQGTVVVSMVTTVVDRVTLP